MRYTRRWEAGQASVEYLLVGLVLIALMGAFAALWHFVANGDVTDLVQAGGIAHALTTAGGVVDALLF